MRLYLLLHFLVLPFIKASVCFATSLSQAHILELFVLLYWRWERMIAVLNKFSQCVGKPILTSDFQFCLYIYIYYILGSPPVHPYFASFCFSFKQLLFHSYCSWRQTGHNLQFQSLNKYSNGSHSSEKSPGENNKNDLMGQKWSSP